MRRLSELIVLIKGAGEVASGVAHRLHRSRFRVCMTEIEKPMAVCRGSAFSEAVLDGTKAVEGVTAELSDAGKVYEVWKRGHIPVVIDPRAAIIAALKPDVVVDAIMSKHNTGTKITDAPLVIGLGPGFWAGKDVHVIIETNHGNDLGRIITAGESQPDTGNPVSIGGLAYERVVWAPETGIFTSDHEICDYVTEGQTIGRVGNLSLRSPLSGLLRGLIRSGTEVTKGAKLIEVDPVNNKDVCNSVRDRMRAIAGGVLEAIMMSANREK